MDAVPSTTIKVPTVLLVIIAVLLFLLLAVDAYRLVSAQGRLATATEAAQLHRTAIRQLQDNCQTALYDDPDLNGIMAQQFRASECVFQALELMATQNSQMLEFLAASGS